MGCLSITRLHPAISFTVPITKPGWTEILGGVSYWAGWGTGQVLLKNLTQ